MEILRDLRYAFRGLRKAPAFASIAILTLALGIGANTAIFSFVDAVLLRSLPVRDPQQLIVFTWTARENPKIHGRSSYGDCPGNCELSVTFFKAVRAQASVFSGMAAFAGPLSVDFAGNGPASISRGLLVSGEYFAMLGVKPSLGRLLAPEDDSASAPPAIVLSYSYWQRAFSKDPAVIGRVVRLNSVSAVIVGVAEPRFTHLTPGKTQDFFMPLSLSDRVRSEWWGNKDRLADPAIWWVVVAARLKPDTTLTQAQAAATTIFKNEVLRGVKPLSKEADAPAIHLLPASKALSAQTSRIAPALYFSLAGVGLVVLIASANIAGMLLARSASRQKEVAVRLSLGAGRARVVRQLLTESLLLSIVGAAVGMLLAVWISDAIVSFASADPANPFPYEVILNARIFLFAAVIAVLAGVLSGLAPALRGTRMDLAPALKQAASHLRDSGGPRRWLRLGDALVIGQVALSIIVLMGAGLFLRTLRNLREVNPGFNTHNILLFGINPKIAGYSDAQTAHLYRELQNRLTAIPGVVSASYSESALLSQSWSGNELHLDTAPPKANITVNTLPVGLDFFYTMRIPLLRGRAFTPGDFSIASATNLAIAAANASHPPSVIPSPAERNTATSRQPSLAPVPVIVNQAFAHKYFQYDDPLGKHIANGQRDEPTVGPDPGYRIVGIVADTKYGDLRSEVAPMVYEPLVTNSAHFELRTVREPTALITAVRDAVSRVDNNLPLFELRTQTEQIDQILFQERLMTRLSSFFALLALVVACIGLYGLLSYEVARRTRELGIRMALGGRQRDVLKLVLQHGLALAAAGAVLGIATGMGATRLLASMLYNVKPNDPLTIAGVAILLLLVSLVACYVPARRAMRVDPIVALRYE